MEEKNFTVWVFRLREDSGNAQGHFIREPAEAADIAEQWLQTYGVPGESYAEIRFNGDPIPHTTIVLLEREGREWVVYGVHNSEHAQWPIFYQEGDIHGIPMDELPPLIESDQAKRKQQAESEKKAKSDEGNMKLDEIEEEDDGDEGTEDEEVPEEDGEEDDFSDEDEQGDENSEDGEDEETEGDEDDGSEDDDAEDERDHGGEEDDGDSDEDGDEDTEDEDENSEGDEEAEDVEGDGDDEQESDEEETEMPRLNIFAKLRGPLGWRKRAEAEELNERNMFAMKLGIVDPEGETPSKQEHEVFAEVQFIETDEDRTGGLLKLKLPEGVEFSERTKAGWITARIPYRQED